MVHLRAQVVGRGGRGPRAERAAMRAARWVMADPKRFAAAERMAARTRRLHPKRLPGIGGAWTDSRDLPEVPAQSFRDWWIQNHGDRVNDGGNGRGQECGS